MVKTTLQIEGMGCGRCEAKVSEAISSHFSVKSVTASHSKGIAEILSEAPLEDGKLKDKVEALGFTVTGIQSKPYKKFFFF